MPYYGGFANNKVSLGNIARVALGEDPIVRKATVRNRLMAPGLGVWVCPRRGRPPQGTARLSQDNRGPFVHSGKYS